MFNPFKYFVSLINQLVGGCLSRKKLKIDQNAIYLVIILYTTLGCKILDVGSLKYCPTSFHLLKISNFMSVGKVKGNGEHLTAFY